MMQKKLTPGFVELTQDACWRAFWRKSALRRFLQQHGIAQSKIATWHADESKREFLDRLFHGLLLVRDNKGHKVILAMARSLADMKHFPDLENWEDSAEKVSAAFKAVERVRSELAKLDQQIENAADLERRRKQARQRTIETRNTRQSLDCLTEELTALIPKQGTQEAGYAFERWFYKLISFFEVQARPPYNSAGRQIDGSLTLDGTTFLAETKFALAKTGAPDIDVFMAKITRKADNTMGILISMSGFTSGAVKEASRDRTPMMLLDYGHFFNLVLNGQMTLPDVIRRIKRHASQTGEAFLPADRF
jgi:hypothetical protein